MILKDASEKERLLKFMKISPKKKLEWLQSMNEFTFKFTTKKARKDFWTLREMR